MNKHALTWILKLGFCGAAAALASATHGSLGASAAVTRPAPAPIRPVTDTLWGKEVADQYRYMEALEPATIEWINAQGAYARSVLDSIPARAALEAKIATFTGSIGFTYGYVSFGGRAFFEERVPGSDGFDLIVRDKAGKRTLLDLAALRAAHGGESHAINYFFVSPDGSKVAVGISKGGSEAASIFVYDAGTGQQIAGPIDRADPGELAWSEDSKRLYFPRLKQIAADDDEAEKYNLTLYSWDLRSEPVAVMGAAADRGPTITPGALPKLILSPGAPMAVAVSINGMQPELALWRAPVTRLNDKTVKWIPFVTREDGVTAAQVAGDAIYLLSQKNAPTFQVLRVRFDEPFSSAKVLLPAAPDRVINSVWPAADALYVVARRGAYSILLRIPHGSTEAEEIVLPFKGHIEEAFSDARETGITISLQSFVVPPTTLAYDPQTKRFADLKLGTTPAFDSSRYEVRDHQARSHDGVMVPYSLVQPLGVERPQIVLIQAYGSFGYSQLANFSRRAVSLLEAGGTFASCNVRGGGELGEAWRLGGKDSNKPNTWRDLIACAEDLIARGVTTKEKLFILGGSAGGITVGRAMTERPELFAGVIALVPTTNTLRMEFEPTGQIKVPEFGTVKTAEGFQNLYQMDTIQHVRAGVQYPAVLITTGLNDPRVLPWQPAKLAAALQASGSAQPVLFRVDADAGHGIGSTKAQEDSQYADICAFVFWRAGLPDWQPRVLGN
jgi:prolyl oligopeptidase